MTSWKSVLELDSDRHVTGGSADALCRAIGSGADLRIETTFRHNEHIDTSSHNAEWVREVSEFRVTYLLERRWTAGFMTLRQPVAIPLGFGDRPSLSLFLYNQDGQQAIARPYLDGATVGSAAAARAAAAAEEAPPHEAMPLYRRLDRFDAGTNAPSENFVYRFGEYRYRVNDDWQEALSHEAGGTVIRGSLDALTDAWASGREVKVGIRGLCADLSADPGAAMEHEVFVQVGFTYYYTESRLFLGETHPVVRVSPAIPLRYASRNWDYGWLMPRTDGFVAMLLYDPYTLRYRRKDGHYPIRWFVK